MGHQIGCKLKVTRTKLTATKYRDQIDSYPKIWRPKCCFCPHQIWMVAFVLLSSFLLYQTHHLRPLFNSLFSVFLFIEIAKLHEELVSPFEVILFYFHIFRLIDLLLLVWCKFDRLWLFYFIGLWMWWLFLFHNCVLPIQIVYVCFFFLKFFNTYGHMHPIYFYNFLNKFATFSDACEISYGTEYTCFQMKTLESIMKISLSTKNI